VMDENGRVRQAGSVIGFELNDNLVLTKGLPLSGAQTTMTGVFHADGEAMAKLAWRASECAERLHLHAARSIR
jgi:hypothetical protein